MSENSNLSKKSSSTELGQFVVNLIFLIPSMLLLRSFVATGTGNSLKLLEKSSNNRARTGRGLSDFFMVGLSDGLSDIRYPTFSCTIRRVVSWIFSAIFLKNITYQSKVPT